MVKGVICCADAQSLRRAEDGMGRGRLHVAATVVHVRALALPTMFPEDVRDAVARLPYAVACVVAPPEAAALLFGPVALGETVVVVGGERVGLIARGTPELPAAVTGALAAVLGGGRNGYDEERLHGWPGRQSSSPRAALNDLEHEDEGNADPFEVLGIGPEASFDQVRAAWRARLAEYHPDKYAQAGVKIRAVAADESRRLNAAYARIAAQAGKRPLPKV